MSNVWHHDPSLPRDVQAIFDPLGNAVHTVPAFDVTRTVDVRTETIPTTQVGLGMKEGFDGGLELSGQAGTLRDMPANMAHGGKIAMRGILDAEMGIDRATFIFNGLMIHGIYGRRMYETWYKMAAMLQSGLDIEPVITHRFPCKAFEEGFDVMTSGRSGKMLLDWSRDDP